MRAAVVAKTRLASSRNRRLTPTARRLRYSPWRFSSKDVVLCACPLRLISFFSPLTVRFSKTAADRLRTPYTNAAIMDEHSKSLALRYDLFVNNVLRFLDTTTERGEYYYIVNLLVRAPIYGTTQLALTFRTACACIRVTFRSIKNIFKKNPHFENVFLTIEYTLLFNCLLL